VIVGAIADPLILVVDDFDDAREMYSDYLVYSGFRVAGASNGAHALDRALALHPDLILMDLSMPGMDGWEATRRLKANPDTQQIPVIALTGHALDSYTERALQAGCDGCLVKPCLPARMVTEVRRLLGHREVLAQ
jgi:CheY-like chemotaxis protein